MKFWIIAMKDVTIRLRDRRGFLALFLMPLVLTLILGSALGGVFNDEAMSMPNMKLAVYNGDDGTLGKMLVDDVFKSDSLKKYVTINQVTNEDDVRKNVRAGQADGGIVIPQGFTQNVSKGNATQINVVQDPGKPTTGSIVKSIVTSFSNRVTTVAAATKQVISDMPEDHKTLGQQEAEARARGKNVPPPPPIPPLPILAQNIANDLSQIAANPSGTVTEMPIGIKAVTAKQYYAAGMAVMFLLFNATIGAKMILNERETETLARMMSTPTSKLSILLGKFTGTLIFAVLQFAVLLVATHFGFGVDWGSNIGQIASIAVGYAIAVSGISMAVAAIVASAQNADMVSQILVQVFSILGGSMIPLSAFPDLMRKISLITPNAWALNSLTEIMSGTTWQTLQVPLIVLCSIGLVMLCLGTWRLQTARRM